MPDPDYKALCAELIDALDSGIPAGRIRMSPLAVRARALLDQPVVCNYPSCVEDSEDERCSRWLTGECQGPDSAARAALAQPEPVAPTDEELLELLSRVSGLLDYDAYIVDGGRIMSEPNELLVYARSVLARWGTPANNTGGTQYDG